MKRQTQNVSNTCGNSSCNESQLCFLLSSGPRCAERNSKLSSWMLNNESFPPITYHKKLANREKDLCESFSYSDWSDSNKDWLLKYFYDNWLPSTIARDKFPNGSFVQPLNYLGNCFGDELGSSKLPSLYCSPDQDQGVCVKKLMALTPCNSSNQCISANCGNIPATSYLNGTIKPNNASLCIDSDTGALLTSNGTRDLFLDKLDSYNADPSGSTGSTGSYSAGQMTVAIVAIGITFLSILFCCCIRKFINKQGSNERSIEPEGRVRRGASILLNRNGSLNRSDSVRTLPQYSAVAEEVTYQPGIVSSIVNYFFPPGELPPPYESVHSVEGLSNYVSDMQQNSISEPATENAGGETMLLENNDDNVVADPVAILKVRDDVTFEEVMPTMSSSALSPNGNGGITTELPILPEVQDIEESDTFVTFERRESEVRLTEGQSDENV